MDFVVPKKVKTLTLILMALGVIGLIWGFVAGEFAEHGHVPHGHDRWWANILIDGFFFFGLAAGALFFYALQYVAEVAWSAQLKRIFESMYSFLLIGGGVIILVLVVGSFHGHHLYHWMDSDIYAEYVTQESLTAKIAGEGHVVEVEGENIEGAVANPYYDSIIAGKKGYFGMAFFWLRTLLYIGIFFLYARKFRQMSLEEDRVGGTEIHFRMFRKSAVFLIFFAVFSSTMAWDWLMSIDTHWFSTMYGWYIFSGMWVTTMIFATLLVLWLKKLGHLPKVNKSHIHDLGKWMFAISMLWSYIWFSQFMLIWYADIPEEVAYYQMRFENYKGIFLVMFFVNFVIPFYALIARDAKRNPIYLIIVGVVIFFGHFVDIYMAVIPGTQHAHWNGMKLYEIMMFLGFLGFFIHWVLKYLTKAPLIPVNHPFLEESENHHI